MHGPAFGQAGAWRAVPPSWKTPPLGDYVIRCLVTGNSLPALHFCLGFTVLSWNDSKECQADTCADKADTFAFAHLDHVAISFSI